MCKSRKDNQDKYRDLGHVKILTMLSSNLTDESKGVYLDAPFYRFENIQVGKIYLHQTIKIEGIWIWQL